VALLFPVVLLLLLFYLFHGLIPAWLMPASMEVLRGQNPHLTTAETIALGVGGGIGLVLLFGGAYLLMVLMSRIAAPRIDDPRLVSEKRRVRRIACGCACMSSKPILSQER